MISARFQVSFEGFTLDLDLQLPPRGLSVILGESGSGKTTLLRCIAGLQATNESFLKIGDQIWVDSRQNQFRATHQRSIGYVFQQANLFPHLSVAENIDYGRKRLKQSLSNSKLADLIQLLGLSELMSRSANTLSGGEQQRVAIARALAMEPEILLMDEPLAALDWQRKQEILPYLQRLQQNLEIPIIYVTHSLQEMAQLADHVVMLKAGKIQAQGSLSAILQRPDLAMNQQADAFSVWSVRLLDHDSRYALSRVGFDHGELFLPQLAVLPGQDFRLQIYARDVSLTLQQAAHTSILNVLAATIVSITETAPGQCLIHLQISEQSLLAQITRKSQESLNLKVGMSVFAQIKGSSVFNQR